MKNKNNVKAKETEVHNTQTVYDIDDFIFANEPYYVSDK